MFNTQSLNSGPFASYDIDVKKEDKAYRTFLYDNSFDTIEGYNFMIENIIGNILQRKYKTITNSIIDVKGVEIKFPQFVSDQGNYLMTPFIARMTASTLVCEVHIIYTETKETNQGLINGIQYGQNNILINDKIKSRKIGSFYCMVGSNRDITSVKPDEIANIDEWKMMLGECPSSPAGYIITNGGEKVIDRDEKLRNNIPVTFKTKGDNPTIETRITCINNSITSLIRFQIGRKRPTLKVMFTHLKGRHYPQYLTFYLLYYAYTSNTTTEKTEFYLNKFEELIASFAPAEEKDRIIAYLRPSKEKFIELFITVSKDGSLSIDENKIKEYIHHKLGNQKTKNAEEDVKRFIMPTVVQNVTKEVFAQTDIFREKVATLCYTQCQLIRCGNGDRDLDSRDKTGKKKVGTLVQAISNYAAVNLVSHIENGSVDTVGFNFGKGENKEAIIETRKCETLNAAIAQRDKIINQVDARTNSISLREVSQDQLPNICPAKTPEGETCGLNKQQSALSHTSRNCEYLPTRRVIFDDLFEPYLTYFSTKMTSVFKYKFATISFQRAMFLHYGTSNENISTEGIYVSIRILTLFKDLFSKKLATYYIDNDLTIFIKFDQSLNLTQYAYETHLGGNLYTVIPNDISESFRVATTLVKNPDYKISSSLVKTEDCTMNIAFRMQETGILQTVTIVKTGSFLFVSKYFVELLKTIINKNDKVEIIKDGAGKVTCVVTCKSNLKKFDYMHWTANQVACMIPEYMQKSFGTLLGVINEYISTEKSKTFSYSFTFNGIILTDPNTQGFFPKIIWSNGRKLVEYLKRKRRTGDIPYDSCIHLNTIDNCVQYFDDAGRLMSPMLIVNDDGELMVDKFNSWGEFEKQDFENSQKHVDKLYNEGSVEMIDSVEMDTTNIAMDLNECRTIFTLRKFLKSLDLKNIKSCIYLTSTDGYYRNEDLSSVKIHDLTFEVEFTKVKPQIKSLEFQQPSGDTEIYYGTYIINKKIYKEIDKNIYKLTKPTNGMIKDTFYMAYMSDNGIKFITEDDTDLMHDGENVYIESKINEMSDMEGYSKRKIEYINFEKNTNEIYLDENFVIINVTPFKREHLDENVFYVYDNNIIPYNKIVDKHFVKVDKKKFAVVDEYHFPEGKLEAYFDFKTVKIHEYIPEEIKDYTKFDYDLEMKKPLDSREASLYSSIIRRQLENLRMIPENYEAMIKEKSRDEILDYQFSVLSLLREEIAHFGNKKIMLTLRRYYESEFKFTHCLIDPGAAYSVIANFVPKADSNPGPRFSYQCSMGTQAMGVGNCVWYRRYETSNKRLIEPTEHSFETVAELPLNQVTMPITQNFVFLVAANYKGFEDAIVLSKSALTKFGRYEKEVTIKIVESQNKDFVESVCYPTDRSGNPKTGHLYRHLDKNGLPRLGSLIKVKDCIVGRSKIYVASEEKKMTEGQKRSNNPFFAGVGNEGIVTDVVVIAGEGTHQQFRTIIIKMVQRRKQQAGDKMAARFSQKGTIGDIIGGMINTGDPRLKIVDDCLMPYVIGGPNDGLRAECIFNPASFPSRMTCGLIDEIFAAKSALYLQEKINASNFTKFIADYWRNGLYENKITSEHLDINGDEFMCHSDGEIMIDSTTGKPMKFNIGIVAYQFLKHHVDDKKTARSSGEVKSITHQPDEGRSVGGGQRMGEMERDAMLSSGATGVIYDKFMICSDGYVDVFCSKCGNNSSISNLKSKMCSICGTSGTLVTVNEPRIFKVFCQQMNAIGFEIKETLRPIDDFQADISKQNKIAGDGSESL